MRFRFGEALKLAAFLAFAGASAYVLFFTPAGEMFRTPEGRKFLVERLDHLVRAAGPLGPALFVIIYALGSLFAPVTPFTIAGAFIFGKFLGMVYNFAGEILGASIAFYLGRYFLRGMARNFLETKLPWLDRKVEREGFTVIFYLRIFWFPFIVLNYSAGATRIRFGDYFLGTILGVLPAVMICTYFIGALKDLLASYRQPSDLFTFHILAPIALLIFSFFIPALMKRIRKPSAG